jgi:hypothetical protein
MKNVMYLHHNGFLIFKQRLDQYRMILKVVRTPQLVTIEPVMPHTNVDLFREKGAKSFPKKVWE